MMKQLKSWRNFEQFSLTIDPNLLIELYFSRVLEFLRGSTSKYSRKTLQMLRILSHILINSQVNFTRIGKFKNGDKNSVILRILHKVDLYRDKKNNLIFVRRFFQVFNYLSL